MSRVLALIAALVIVVLLSHLREAFRRWPEVGGTPAWLPGDGRQDFVRVDGTPLRRVVSGVGRGRPVLLLHTLRTQLELFREVIPVLAETSEVHAIDLPGHGFSGIPAGAYDPERFARAVRGYLETAGLEDALLVGESIGGTIALLLAAEGHPRVAGVVAVNAYDYDRGRGIHRGSMLSRLIFTATRVPVLGPTIWRLRWPGIFARVIRASVHRPERLDPELVRAMHDVGNRPGHYRAFVSLIRHFPAWPALRRRYPEIRLPTTFVYGDHDWSTPEERRSAVALVDGARRIDVADAGHLLSFDAPRAVVAAVHDALEACHER
jgi:pimeloyl-ACP methyl ester carboxylesterase